MVFTFWDKVSDESIDKVYSQTNKLRGLHDDVTTETVAGLKQLFSSFSLEEQYHHHTAKQAQIAFGMAIAAAAELGDDATPMEGFRKQGVDEFLKLREKSLRSVVLLDFGNCKEDGDGH